ncbi:DUF4112 domain-containing protein [Lichenicoccus sp.]|uniref:DUF4112 domain-containing protein n=1 Tax=Lichenicoccus sp. TaxID=2781899 RepID=UPI003D09BEC5
MMSATSAHAGLFESAAGPAKRLARLRRLAWMMDGAFRIPGSKFRFGLNSVLGLPPVAGDVLLSAVSLYIVYEGYRLGLPRVLIGRMLANVAVEAAAGSVPIVGDLFDVAFKANLRNLALIDSHLRTGPR